MEIVVAVSFYTWNCNVLMEYNETKLLIVFCTKVMTVKNLVSANIIYDENNIVKILNL